MEKKQEIIEIKITLHHGYKEKWLDGIFNQIRQELNNWTSGQTGITHFTVLKERDGQFLTDDDQHSYSIHFRD
jgi:hypothetical protein